MEYFFTVGLEHAPTGDQLKSHIEAIKSLFGHEFTSKFIVLPPGDLMLWNHHNIGHGLGLPNDKIKIEEKFGPHFKEYVDYIYESILLSDSIPGLYNILGEIPNINRYGQLLDKIDPDLRMKYAENQLCYNIFSSLIYVNLFNKKDWDKRLVLVTTAQPGDPNDPITEIYSSLKKNGVDLTACPVSMTDIELCQAAYDKGQFDEIDEILSMYI